MLTIGALIGFWGPLYFNYDKLFRRLYYLVNVSKFAQAFVRSSGAALSPQLFAWPKVSTHAKITEKKDPGHFDGTGQMADKNCRKPMATGQQKC